MEPGCCSITDNHFSEAYVREELRTYRAGKLAATTRMLLSGLRQVGDSHATMLDIGAGCGIITHELLSRSRMTATVVEISSAFLDAARIETAARDLQERVRFVQGDVVAVAGELDAADIVVCDRVVCCYEDWQGLIAASTLKCRRVYALSYPRDNWLSRVVNAFKNWRRRRRGNPFQAHVHSEAQIDRAIHDAGFERTMRRRSVAWVAAMYTRDRDHAQPTYGSNMTASGAST